MSSRRICPVCPLVAPTVAPLPHITHPAASLDTIPIWCPSSRDHSLPAVAAVAAAEAAAPRPVRRRTVHTRRAATVDRRLIRSRTSSASFAATRVPASITDNLPVKVSQIKRVRGVQGVCKGWLGLGNCNCCEDQQEIASSDINCAHDEPARKRQQIRRKEGEKSKEKTRE